MHVCVGVFVHEWAWHLDTHASSPTDVPCARLHSRYLEDKSYNLTTAPQEEGSKLGELANSRQHGVDGTLGSSTRSVSFHFVLLDPRAGVGLGGCSEHLTSF